MPAMAARWVSSRRVREQNAGARGTLTQHLLHDCRMRRASPERYVINSGQDQSRDWFDTFIAQHVEARAAKEIDDLRASGVELVISRYNVHAVRSAELLQYRQPVGIGRFIAFEDVAHQQQEVGMERLKLSRTFTRPVMAEQGSQMHVASRHEHRSIGLAGQSIEDDLVLRDDRGTPRLDLAL